MTEMAKSKDFKFVNLRNDDFDEVIHFVSQYFIPFEPISMGLGNSIEHTKDFFESYVRKHLSTGVTIGTRTDEGKLIGVNLAAIERRDDVVESSDDTNSYVKHIFEILDHMTDNYNVFQKQGVNEVLYHAIGCVHPEYQCRSINKIMKLNTEQKALEKGARVAYSISTGVKSQASLQKNGYVTGYEAQYKIFDFLNLTAMGEHKSCKLMVKRLN